MKYKKIVSGLLACAMVVTSVFSGNVTTAKAAEQPTPIATYDFNAAQDAVSPEIGTLADGVEKIEAVKNSLNEYTGAAVYGQGRTDGTGDCAVEIGQYGLELPHKNVGSQYTVSLWVKPTQTVTENQQILFIGYHDPERWLGVAGKAKDNSIKLWTRDANDETVISGTDRWPTFGTTAFEVNEWSMLTVTQNGTTVNIYKNGEKVTTTENAVWAKALEGENQSIYLGKNYWDLPFNGYIDDVSVYNQELTADQVKYLYNGTDDKSEILQKFTATESLELIEGQEGQITTTLPTGIEESEVTFTYQSSDAAKAEVDATGKVTAKAAGTVIITTTATLANNGGTATKDTTVTVKSKGDVLAEKGITVDKTMLLAEGESQTINVTLPEGLTKNDVTYAFASSDTAKATVDAATGKVTAVATGTATITTTATIGEKKAEATTAVTVRAAIEPTINYNFNDSTLAQDVKVVGKGAADSTAIPAFDTGRTGEATDKAVKLGEYALGLPVENIGSKYTISMWVNPSEKLAVNQAVFIAGQSTPAEEWVGFAGTEGNTDTMAKAKLWSNSQSYPGKHTTFDEPTFPVNGWTMLTLTQDGSTLKFYKNGTLVKTQEGVTEALNGAGRKLFVGATYWSSDALFKGLVDDIVVYNDVLSNGEVEKLYRGDKTDEDLLREGEITATPDRLNVNINESKDFTITLPDGVSAENATITYTSDATATATVVKDSENPLKATVTGVAAGDAVITANVKIGDAEQEDTVSVTVKDPSAEKLDLAVDYDFANTETGDEYLIDKSGNDNDALIHGDNIKFEKDGDRDVMNITNVDSYLDLPMGIMDSLTDKEAFTIEATYAKRENTLVEHDTSWLFNFGSKPKSTGTNYLFYCPYFSYGGGEMRAGIKNASSEKLFETGLKLKNDQYYNIVLVFDHGDLSMYLDGVRVGKEDVLESGYSIVDDVIKDGCEGDILGYIGKSVWAQDTNFVGKISTFKIHNKAMTQDDVIDENLDQYQQAFQKRLDDGLTIKSILGRNTSENEVRYNLSLPSTFEELPVTWEALTDNITAKGVIKSGAESAKARLKATVTSGKLTATKTYEVTIVPVDKTKLDEALAEAQKAMGDQYYAQDSKDRLQKLIDKAAIVGNQSEVDSLVKNIENCIKNMEYSDLYLDPFTEIDKVDLVKENASVMPKGTVSVMNKAVPASVKDIVTVSYKSQNTSVATVNSSGTVTGVKAGYALILTTVTAKSDGYAVEYQTLVKVDFDVKGITAKAKATALAKGKTTTISVAYPKAYSTALKNSATVTYRATGAVSVDKKGKVTAKKAGTGKVYVKVSLAGKSITKTVTVNVGEITGPSSVKIKKSITLKVTGIKGKVKWSLDKKGKKLAKITQKGKLTALKKTGKVKVTAKVGKVSMTKTITIKKK